MSFEYLQVVVGDGGRPIQVRERCRVVLRLGQRNPALDVADRFEIFGNLPPVADAQALLETRQARRDVVEHALLFLEPRGARLRVGAVAVAEQPLEHRTRIDFRGQRTARSTPRHRHVRAGVARVAIAGERLRLQPELERCQLRVSAERAGGDLIGRNPQAKIGAAGLVRMHAREECRGRTRVVARAVAQRTPGDLREPAEHVQMLAERLERLHRRTELEVRADRFRRPQERPRALVAGADDPVRRVDIAESNRRLCAEHGGRGPHGIEQRKCDGGAQATQERPPRERLVQIDHDSDRLRI